VGEATSAYIEAYINKLQETIDKNITYAEKNPYPLEELLGLKEAEPDSAISQMFGENGEINGTGNLRAPAMTQDKDLYKKLYRGNKGLNKLKRNEMLSSADPEELLNQRYSSFISNIGAKVSLGANINVDDILNSPSEDFEEYYDYLVDSDYFIDPWQFSQAAFVEISSNEAGTEEENTQDILNEEAQAEEIEEGTEIGEPIVEAESTVSAINVASSDIQALPEELEETGGPEILQEEAIEQATSPINEIAETKKETGTFEDVQGEDATLEDIEVNKETQAINNIQNIENISNKITNEGETLSPVSNTTEVTNEGEMLSSVSNVTDVINEGDINKSTSSTGSTVESSTSSTGSTVESSNNFMSFLQNITGEDYSTMNFGENIEETVKGSNALNETVSSIKEKATGAMESTSAKLDNVSNFNPIGDSSLVPTPGVTKEDISNVGANISKSVSKINSSDESTGSEMSKKEERQQRREEKKTEREDNKKERQSSRGGNNVGIDTTVLEKRLRSIELLLQGPLEVKFKR
jgi:hypothetical protein